MGLIHSSVACNLDTNILLASLPLFESEKVGAIEWAFDTLFAHNQLPDWFDALLKTYSSQNRLIGHGVFFSLFSGRWTPDQQAWLDKLKTLSATYHFDHVTEHFGFMTGDDFHKGAPISIPFTASTLAIGQDRLQRIQQVCGCPVGLENLAFSYSIDEVRRHGDFLEKLLEPINGFTILDLHNLYCQSENFHIDPCELLRLYPLDRVREIHISGGSWSQSTSTPGKQIRRDTHDDGVPDAVFKLLQQTLSKCPDLKYVVLEQLGTGLTTQPERSRFQQDFFRMNEFVEQQNAQYKTPAPNLFLPLLPVEPALVPPDDQALHDQQMALSTILEMAVDYEQALSLLRGSELANSAWQVEQWEPFMLETALAIAQKWQHGYD